MAQIFGNGSGDMRADRRLDFALQLAERGDFAAAADILEQAIELAPAWPPLHFHLADTLSRSDRTAGAIAAYQSYLEYDPADHMGATLKLSILGHQDAPPALPTQYIQSLFDEYAPRFDESLVGALEYRAPWQIADAIKTITPGRIFDTMLDLGCGTGLACEAAGALCNHKTGIDLSPEMVEQARTKSIYDTLDVATLEDYLSQCLQHFDLVLSADVLVYIGALEDIFINIARVMNDNALFGFSVQYLESGTWILGKDHRYAHSSFYIHHCAAQSGLKILTEKKVALRKDGANMIEGLIFICQKNN